MTTMLVVRSAGSFDHARPVDQMRAIDLVLCHYFGTSDWPRARAEARSKKLTR